MISALSLSRYFPSDRRLRVIIAVSFAIGVAQLGWIVLQGPRTMSPDLLWLLDLIATITTLLSVAGGAFLWIGHYHVCRDHTSYWLGTGLSSFFVTSSLRALTNPWRPGGRGFLGHTTGTITWISLVGLTVLAGCLLAAAKDWSAARPLVPQQRRLGLLLFLPALTLMLSAGIVAFDRRLPSLVSPDGVYSQPVVFWAAATATLLAVGAFAALERYLETGTAPLAYIGFSQITLTFGVLAMAITRNRFSVLSGVDRLIISAGYVAMLFGLLSEYADLLSRERQKSRDLQAQTQQLTQLHRSLAQSEERLNLALQASDIGIWEYYPLTGRSFLDSRVRHLLGLPPSSEIPLEMIVFCLHPEDREMFDRQLQVFRDPDAPAHLAMEFRIYRRDDGRLRHLLAQGRSLFDGEGANRRAIRALGTLQDVTLLKNREDALRRINEELEQFAYAAAHDLQEPLRNISLSTQLLASHYQGAFDAEGHSLLKVAVEEPIRLQDMVRGLLTFSRALSNVESNELLDANFALTQALQNLSLAIQEKRAVVSSDSLPAVYMSRLHLVQIFQNLIENSLKYSGDNTPCIRVSSFFRNGTCLFAVQDNGLGIPADYCERVFGVFKRIAGRDQPGAGVGLSLCKRIVEHYGGKIWIESELGAGTTVLFTPPVATHQFDAQKAGYGV